MSTKALICVATLLQLTAAEVSPVAQNLMGEDDEVVAKNWAGFTGVLTAAPLMVTVGMWIYVGIVKVCMRKPLASPNSDRISSRARN